MPTYQVEDARGRVLELEGDHEPSQEEAAQAFATAFSNEPTPSQHPTVPLPGESRSGRGLSGPFQGIVPSQAERLQSAEASPAEQALQSKLETPLANLPEALYTPPVTGLIAPDVGAAFGAATKRQFEGMTSPAGLATIPYMAVGGAEGLALKEGAVAARVIASAFGVQGLEQLPDAGKRYVEAIKDGNRTEAAKAWVDLAAASAQSLGVAGAFGIKSALEHPVPPDEVPPMAAPIPTEPIGPESRAIAPESRQLPAPSVDLPEFTQSTLEPQGPPSLALPAPGESAATAGLLEASPEAPRTAGYRIQLPLEPASAKAAREIWSKPIDVEAQVTGADALRQLVTLTDEKKTAGQPYEPPSVSVDLRQLEKAMQRNTVSKVESWADEMIRGKLRDVSANPYFDPEFLAAAAVKAAILVKRGVVAFGDWAGRMRQQFGPGIEPHLQSLFDQAMRGYGKTESTSETPPAIPGAPATSAALSGGVEALTRQVNAARAQAEPSLTPTPAGGGGDVSPASSPDAGPGITGMGAAQEGEVANARAEDLFGISQGAREQMAATGRFPYTPPGQGTTAWAEIQRGRALIRDGADPVQTLADFEKTQRLSSADVAVVRAHMEQLYQQARAIEESKGTNSPEYRAIQREMADWWTRTKPMGTEWHRIGVGQQGMTDIDTGSLVGMEKAYHDATGRSFTEKQTEQAGQHAATVNETRTDASESQQKVLQSIEEETAKANKGAKPFPPPKTATEARTQLGEIKGEMTPQQRQTIWQYAKRYIESGESNLDAITQGVADDLGLPKRTVMEAMAGNKTTRRLTNEMYFKMARARQAQAAARQWLINEQSPGWSKWASRIPRFFFGAKTFGHGTVGMVTHAGPLMFDLRVAKDYWSNFGRQFGLAYRAGYHEAMMQDLLHRPNFVEAKRAGLANDPFSFYDDYQNPQIQAGLGWFTRAGNRGFDALKLMRQDLFDRAWNTLPQSLRTSEAATLIADAANHATGIITSRIPPKLAKALATGFFAPKLEMSRWAFAIGDPAKAAATFTNWKNASPAQRMAAIAEVKQKGAMVGAYFGLLAANQALLAAMKSNQSVNFTDPRKGDFLSFKITGQDVSVVHPFTRMIGLLADLYRISRSDERGKLEKLDTRRNELGERLWQYAQGKASPFAQPVLDVVSQSDFQGRPLPFSDDRLSKSQRRRGLDTYAWPEYLTQTLAPIPVEEALKEVWAAQGMNEKEMQTAFKALTVFGVTGATGVRVKTDQSK